MPWRPTRRVGAAGPASLAPKADGPRDWPPERRYRSLFVSDVHLGAHGCRTGRVLDFLQRNDAETIYLVGDIFDGWRPIRAKWSAEHDAIIHTLIARSRAGTRIVYLPGNHDSAFHHHTGLYFDAIEVVAETVHVAADGRRYLVLHGDCCDGLVSRLNWLPRLGSFLDGAVRGLNALVNRVRGAAGLGESVLIEAGVARVNRMIRAGDPFEARLSALASGRGLDGIVCGHFHRAALHDEHGVIYANCGDWLESCTAIAEEPDGRLRVLDWRGRRAPAAADDGALSEVEEASGLAI